jgi:NADPH:quinone reductase and related Zn-dependent oxidoreductases
MKAAVIDRFGGPEDLAIRDVPVPAIDDDEVLVRVKYAGIGSWDIFEREGGYAEMLGLTPSFPYILGSEGSGVVRAKGKKVTGLEVGDEVYATGFLNPKGGFYAEFAAVRAAFVVRKPEALSLPEAGAVSGIGLTALRGLEDVLRLGKNEAVAILGASGGIGHIAVQLARQMGARVFAIASGEDGASAARALGADAVVDGRRDDVRAAAEAFAPGGFDAALLTAGGELAEAVIRCVRPGGRAAYPHGIHPIPGDRPDIELAGYHGEPDPDIIGRLHERIRSGGIKVLIDRVFDLEEARQAHIALRQHYVGKLCFKI